MVHLVHDYIEVGADTGFTFLFIDFKIWCIENDRLIFLEKAMCNAEAFLTQMERAPREREGTLLQFAFK